jgi:class 3 adenylate cyclase
MRRADRGRGLRTVVFLDTVGSTQIAASLGDQRWQNLLQRELQIMRRLLKAYGGSEVDTAGDGLFALFREPAPAVRFAASAVQAVRKIGLELRAGIHVGELEFANGRPGGIVVHTGARAMSLGGPGEVIVTRTTSELVSGGPFRFADHGTHELKGVPGTWALFTLTDVDDAPMQAPIESEEASSRRQEASAPPPLVRRRAFIIGAGAGAVSIGAAAFALLRAGAEEAQHPGAVPGGDRLFRYDPSTDEIELVSRVFGSTRGVGLPSIAVGEGAVWTADFYLYHVDPQDGSTETVELGRGNSDIMLALTTAFNDVWVVSVSGLHRIDPGDNDELEYRRLPFGFDAAIAEGFGNLWVATDGGRLVRIDPRQRLNVVAERTVGQVLSGVATADDLIWVSDEFGQVIPFDPSRNEALEPVQVGGAPKGLAATEDRLLAVDRKDKSLKVVDLARREFLTSVPIGGQPVDVATGLGFVWVADLDGRIVKVDEARLEEVGRKAIPGPAAALAIDGDREVIWVRTAHR